MRFLLALLALLGAAAAQACPGLQVDDAWVRDAPPGAMMTVAYAKLRNAGTKLLRITGGSSKDFGDAELHRTLVEKGISRMVGGKLEIAPGATVALEPGSWHLMLMNPSHPLKAGDPVSITLRCGRKASHYTFTVKAATE